MTIFLSLRLLQISKGNQYILVGSRRRKAGQGPWSLAEAAHGSFHQQLLIYRRQENTPTRLPAPLFSHPPVALPASQPSGMMVHLHLPVLSLLTYLLQKSDLLASMLLCLSFSALLFPFLHRSGLCLCKSSWPSPCLPSLPRASLYSFIIRAPDTPSEGDIYPQCPPGANTRPDTGQ